VIRVDAFDPQFCEEVVAYNGLGDDVVFAVSTKSLHAGARLFRFDPETQTIRAITDLDETLPKPQPRTIPQGKVHVDFVDIGGVLYGATHIGYYDPNDAVERPGAAEGYAPYPGGWFFAIEGDRVLPLAQAPAGEGIITMSGDPARGLLAALTWPGGVFLTLDVASRTLRNHGTVITAGRICRSLGVDPASGAVWWSDDAGRIWRYDGRIEAVAATPRLEMWRKVVWHPEHRVFYGITWDSAALFRFDPVSLACDGLGTLRVRRAPATLAFAIDGNTIHALAFGWFRSVWHLTFDVVSKARSVDGPLVLADGRHVRQAQSLLLAGGRAYTLGWVGDEILLVSFCHTIEQRTPKTTIRRFFRAIGRGS
jgi:hypothetical protein